MSEKLLVVGTMQDVKPAKVIVGSGAAKYIPLPGKLAWALARLSVVGVVQLPTL